MGVKEGREFDNAVFDMWPNERRFQDQVLVVRFEPTNDISQDSDIVERNGETHFRQGEFTPTQRPKATP